MKRLSKRRWRLAIAAAAVVVAPMANISGVASADTVDDETAIAEAQFEQLDELVGEDGGLGIFRNGTDNVVMIPAEMGSEVDALQATLETQLEGVEDEIHVSQFTTDELTAVEEELGTREGSGIPEEYGYVESYDPETDTSNIETNAPESVLAPLLAAHVGQVSTTFGTVQETSNRFNDTSPFKSGGSIQVGDGACTAGIPAYDAYGNDYMLTAGHCFPMWSQVKNQGGAFMGYVYGRYLERDVELIWDETDAVQYLPRIWTGGTASSESWISIAGPRAARLGTRGLYGSGRTTLLRTRGQITRANIDFCLPKQSKCVNGRSGFGFEGGTNAQGGDSGMPLFTLNSTNDAMVVGMLSGNVIDAHGKVTNLGVSLSAILNTFNGVSMMTE